MKFTPKHALAVALLAFAIVHAGTPAATTARRPSGMPLVYRIQGFLDELPGGQNKQETLLVARNRTQRKILVTSYQRSSTGDPRALFRIQDLPGRTFQLQGDSSVVDRLVTAPNGSRVSMTATLAPGTLFLMIDAVGFELTPPAGASSEGAKRREPSA